MVPSITLNAGNKLDLVGYGTWQAAPNEVKVGIEEALKAGYRYVIPLPSFWDRSDALRPALTVPFVPPSPSSPRNA